MANEEKEDEQERYENQVIQLHTVVGVLKIEKKNVKSNLTRMLQSNASNRSHPTKFLTSF